MIIPLKNKQGPNHLSLTTLKHEYAPWIHHKPHITNAEVKTSMRHVENRLRIIMKEERREQHALILREKSLNKLR